MGYRIVYGPEREIGQPGDKSYARMRIMTALLFLVGCAAVRAFWAEGTEVLRSVLLPGVPTATEQAFAVLLSDLRTGEPIGESVTAFCRFVAEHGTNLPG